MRKQIKEIKHGSPMGPPAPPPDKFIRDGQWRPKRPTEYEGSLWKYIGRVIMKFMKALVDTLWVFINWIWALAILGLGFTLIAFEGPERLFEGIVLMSLGIILMRLLELKRKQ